MHAYMHASRYAWTYLAIDTTVHAYMNMHLHLYRYIYIYMHLRRDRNADPRPCTIYIYIYIYIYMTIQTYPYGTKEVLTLLFRIPAAETQNRPTDKRL